MQIAWTTVSDRLSAETLARAIVDQHLAVCVQIEGPLTSVYRWEGKIEESTEFRLMIKFLPATASALESYVTTHHPYDIPEWTTVSTDSVGEKYLSWAEANSNQSPF